MRSAPPSPGQAANSNPTNAPNHNLLSIQTAGRRPPAPAACHSLRRFAAPLLAALVALQPGIAWEALAAEAWAQRYNGPPNGNDEALALAVDASYNV